MEVTKESFKCDKCGKIYSTKGSLRTHKYNHTKKDNSRTDPTRAIPVTKLNFKSDMCNKTYSTKDSLRAHNYSHLKKDQDKNEENNMNNEEGSKYIDFIFEEPASPNLEVDAPPSQDLGVRYRCPVCDTSCREEEDVKKHIETQHREATSLQAVRQELMVGLERGEGGRRSAQDMDSGQEEGDVSEIEPMCIVGEGRRRTQSDESLQEARTMPQVLISPNLNSSSEAIGCEGRDVPEGIEGHIETEVCPKVGLSPRSSRPLGDPLILTSELKIEPSAVHRLSMALETPSSSRASSRACLTPLPLITGTMREVGEERRRQIRSIVRGLEEEGTADFNIF